MSDEEIRRRETEAKQAVRERDGHRCVDCGKTEDEFPEYNNTALQVHRLVPGSLYNLEGCVLVCIPCHHKRHVEIRKSRHPEGWEMTRFDAELLRKARIVLAIRGDGMPLCEYISEASRSEIEADHERILDEEAKKLSKPPKD